MLEKFILTLESICSKYVKNNQDNISEKLINYFDKTKGCVIPIKVTICIDGFGEKENIRTLSGSHYQRVYYNLQSVVDDAINSISKISFAFLSERNKSVFNISITASKVMPHEMFEVEGIESIKKTEDKYYKCKQKIIETLSFHPEGLKKDGIIQKTNSVKKIIRDECLNQLISDKIILKKDFSIMELNGKKTKLKGKPRIRYFLNETQKSLEFIK